MSTLYLLIWVVVMACVLFVLADALAKRTLVLDHLSPRSRHVISLALGCGAVLALLEFGDAVTDAEEESIAELSYRFFGVLLFLAASICILVVRPRQR